MKKLILIFCILTSLTAFAQRAVPELWGHRVHDEAHILSQTTVDNLEVMLQAHEDSTTNQIAVLIIPSLNGDVLEEYSLRVAHDVWKLGSKDKDNGTLLLIAVDDRKIRIEVGYGLEGVLTDAVTSRIIRNEIAPRFRNQQYDSGVTRGVQAIVAAIKNEYSAGDNASEDDTLQVEMNWKERLLIGAFIFGILGIFTALGLFVQGCTGWFLYAFLIPFYAVFPMVIFGVSGGLMVLSIYAIGVPIVKVLMSKTEWGKRMAKKMNNAKRSGGSGWSSGSEWGSGSSSGGWSSGSSGGGFSGGVGSFGGGGSSGSW